MAIHFFSINGAGGGGGSSAVNTANGISGDGSVGTPVVLGGNPLNAATSIVLAGHTLDFTDVNTDVEFGNGLVFIETIAGSNIGVISAQGGLIGLGGTDNTGKLVGINAGVPSTKGVTIRDDLSNVGITGLDSSNASHLFPLNGDPAQYVQAGHLPSGATVNTVNGISGDGSIGTPVKLGGALNQATTITTNGQELIIGDPALNLATIDLDNTGPGVLHLYAGSAAFSVYSQDSAGIQLRSNPGGPNFVAIDVQDVGLTVTDSTNNVGLVGNGLFPINGNSAQYAQYGNIPGLPSSQSFNGVTSSNTVTYTPVNNSTLRINAVALNHTTASGNLDITCNYTDTQGNPQAFAIQLGITPGTASHAAPSVIRAAAGQPVNIVFNNLGGALYDGAGIIETLIS